MKVLEYTSGDLWEQLKTMRNLFLDSGLTFVGEIG
jgi:hypothetical protein